MRSVDQDQTNYEVVLQHQKAYDTYSAARDPATGLFTAMFGEEWAMDYVHDFLFSMSERPESTPSKVSATSQHPSASASTKNPYATSATTRDTSVTASNINTPVTQRQPQLASISI